MEFSIWLTERMFNCPIGWGLRFVIAERVFSSLARLLVIVIANHFRLLSVSAEWILHYLASHPGRLGKKTQQILKYLLFDIIRMWIELLCICTYWDYLGCVQCRQVTLRIRIPVLAQCCTIGDSQPGKISIFSLIALSNAIITNSWAGLACPSI